MKKINQTGFEKGATFGPLSSHKVNVKHAFSNKISILSNMLKAEMRMKNKKYNKKKGRIVL